MNENVSGAENAPNVRIIGGVEVEVPAELRKMVDDVVVGFMEMVLPTLESVKDVKVDRDDIAIYIRDNFGDDVLPETWEQFSPEQQEMVFSAIRSIGAQSEGILSLEEQDGEPYLITVG